MNSNYFLKLNRNVVTDDDAPEYFSQQAIFGFSILFSIIFGGGLMALNVHRSNNKTSAFFIVACSIIYSAIEFDLLKDAGGGILLKLLFNSIGAYGLNYFCWNRFIGRTTLYRAKPVLIPAILGVVIVLSIWASAFLI